MDALTFPLIPGIWVFVASNGIELVLSIHDSLLKTMRLAPESKIQVSLGCWRALTFAIVVVPNGMGGELACESLGSLEVSDLLANYPIEPHKPCDWL